MFLLFASFNNRAGDNSKEATPDPIPNSVVKLFRVDGTAWVTVWESRSLPAFFFRGLRFAHPRLMSGAPTGRFFLFLREGIQGGKAEPEGSVLGT